MSSKRAQWRERVKAWQKSGESVAGFCRSRGVNYAQFVYWQRVLGTEREEGVSLVPVRVDTAVVETAVVASPSAAIEVMLPSGVRVRVPAGCVAQAIALVRGLSC